MCGIAGIYKFDPSELVSRGMIEHMTNLIQHRGPDDVGYHVDRNIGLGHRRLSIIDVSKAGHQPMSNVDQTIWIIYNGECYNFRQYIEPLTKKGYHFKSHSDTEVLLYLYQEYGPEFIHKIDGMFAFAIWDMRNQQLMLGRDRVGIKPLYFYANNAGIIFASEIKAILADPSVPTELNMTAFSEFMHLMSIPGEDTIFKDIDSLAAGHYATIKNNKIELHQYWDINMPNHIEYFDAQLAEVEFYDRFKKNIASHMVADVPVGVFLSGGVDSSSVAAFAQKNTNMSLNSFSVAFGGYQDYDESIYSRQVANHISTKHHEFSVTPDLINVLPKVIWHADQPFAISSSFALYLLSELASQHVKVVLTGDGADEVFGGYLWRHADFPPLEDNRNIVFRKLLIILSSFAETLRQKGGTGLHNIISQYGLLSGKDNRYLQSFSTYHDQELNKLLLPDIAKEVGEQWQFNVTQSYYDKYPGASELSRKLFTDIKSTLVSEMLTKVDRMTMAFGLEARVPFLDHRLIEWAFSLSDKLKICNSDGKYIVKKAMEKLLPKEILYRPKQGFNVPMRIWMRGELRDLVHELLSAKRVKERGLFNPHEVNNMLASNDSDDVDISNRLFVLMCLELWFQQYIDNRQQIAFSG